MRNFALGLTLLAAGQAVVKAQVWTINVCSSMPSATQSNTYGPMYSVASANATNRLTSIYPASQLTGIASQMLTSIYFHTENGHANGMLGTPNLKVYLKEVSNSDWGSGALDWATASTGATLVFDGNPAPLVGTGGGWKQIPFTTNFTYSGNQNLAVFLEYNNPTASNSITWSYEYTSPCVSGSSSGEETKYSNNTTGTLPASLTSRNSRRPYIGFDHPVLCPAPTNVATTGITQNGASITWTAGGSETSWDYAIQPAGGGIPTTFSNTTTTTLNPTTLISNTNYEFYVRAVCGGTNGNSILKGPYTFKTLCGPMTSMFENFDSYSTGNIVPDCWTRIVGASNTAQTISSSSPASGTRNILQTTSTAANATVVVLPEFSNVNAGTHWLRFKARVSSGTGSLDVGYITNSTDASTFVNIQTISIANTSYAATNSEYKVIIPNTVPANARLAIRNAGTSTASHYWDDVYWEAAPTCFAPATVSVSNITAISAMVEWVASTTPPANGYDVYYSTTNTPPTATTTPSVAGVTGLSTVINLAPSTQYYVWIRTNCTTTDISNWTELPISFSTVCQPPVLSAVTGATFCAGQTATLSATADSGATINWYDAATAGNIVGTGAAFTTPALTNTTNYWVSAGVVSNSVLGPVNATIGAGGYSTSETYRTFFTAHTAITIESVDVFPNTTGQSGTIDVYTASGTLIQSVPYTTTSSGSTSVPQVVPLNISVSAGDYYMKMGSNSVSLYRNTAGATFPYTSSLISLTGQSFSGYPNYYYFFYNWKVNSLCESARTMVTATLDSNCLSTSEVNGKDAIKVYPNPFSEVININKPELVKSIKITDVSGKLIRNINQPESTLRLQDLSQGMYILILEMKNGVQQSIKVIKK